MTEAEWLAATDPTPMLEFLRGKASERKLRLFACGCCCRHPDILDDVSLQQAIHAMEQLAEGLLNGTTRPRYNTFMHRSLICRLGAASGITAAFGTVRYLSKLPLSSLCRCVFGNPFLPEFIETTWMTSNVVALACGIYQERAFDRMPILADALQDAGCDSDDILAHCRGDGPHVRGCWVVDLLLGKE
ncbi:hypothetical protein [Fimbriiglobus ruber]|nr:hypothetical protein [Fimbriiglobus ruber]